VFLEKFWVVTVFLWIGYFKCPVNPRASRAMKTYSESRIELRNPQILKNMLEKSRQFLSSE